MRQRADGIADHNSMVPTVVIQGDEDPVIPMEAARDVAANIPGADFRIIRGMGHDIPPRLENTVVDAIVSAASRADQRRVVSR
jgi:pimeloyl-ACP methyl ester carboxylesterase